MKKFITFAAAMLITATAHAGEITLTNPTQAPVVTKVVLDAYKMDSSSIIAEVSFRTTDGVVQGAAKVILVDECVGSSGSTKAECEAVVEPSEGNPGHAAGVWNNWFSAVENDKVVAGDVDKKTSVLLERKIRNQVKQRLGLVGTVAP